MGKFRKAWQDFKKDYPDFERSKDLKADSGPALDKYEKALDTVTRAVKDVIDSASEWDKAADDLVAVLVTKLS